MRFRLQTHHYLRAEQALYAWGEYVRTSWAAPNSLQTPGLYKRPGDLAQLPSADAEKMLAVMEKMKRRYAESFELCKLIYLDGQTIPREVAQEVDQRLRVIQGWVFNEMWPEVVELERGRRRVIATRNWRKMKSTVRVIVYEK